MRLHPEWGAEMVARVPGLEAVALIVQLHHERPDGQGYPYGLTTDQIPMASRIVSACAAYGVMTKSWAHRDPMEIDAALDELRQTRRDAVRPGRGRGARRLPAAARARRGLTSGSILTGTSYISTDVR